MDDLPSQEVAVVEAQISNELGSTQQLQLHPRVEEMLPLSANLFRPLLLSDVTRLEQLLNVDSDTTPLHVLSPAIDLERYVEFGDGDNVDYDRVYTAMSYGILRERNSRLLEQNLLLGLEAQHAVKVAMEDLSTSYSHEIARKRLRIEEISAERQRKQAQFQPVGSYLELRWRSGVQALIDKGISRMADSSSE